MKQASCRTCRLCASSPLSAFVPQCLRAFPCVLARSRIHRQRIRWRPAMKSLQGHLLVASPKLVDRIFFHAVVLLVQHNDEGALGLVLSRPMQTTVKEMWREVGESSCEVEGALHQGGPCEGPLMVVHEDESASEVEVMKGVHFCTSRERIESLVEDNDSAMKFFV